MRRSPAKARLSICHVKAKAFRLLVWSLFVLVLAKKIFSAHREIFSASREITVSHRAAQQITELPIHCGAQADNTCVEPVTVVVMSAGKRIKELAHIVEYYVLKQDRRLVYEVHIVWNSAADIPLDAEILKSSATRVHKETHNSLNNRYRHWKSIHTRYTLLLDDDCLVADVLTAVRIQMLSPERAMIFFARSHKSTRDGLSYVNPKRLNGSYSMGTGQATLLSTKWLKEFNTDFRLQRIRAFIDKNRPTCEDIALHMYITNSSGLPPLLISAGQRELRWTRGTGMSDDRNWGAQRKQCLNEFIALDYAGKIPLKYSEFLRPVNVSEMTVGLPVLHNNHHFSHTVNVTFGAPSKYLVEQSISQIHVTFACDSSAPGQLRLLSAALRSILSHAADPHRLSFHVFVGKGEENHVSDALRCALVDWQHFDLTITAPPEEMVDLPIKIRYPGKSERRLRSSFNYVRFFLHLLLPQVNKVLYLDTDVIVLDDIANLYDAHLVPDQSSVLAACARNQLMSKWINFTDPDVINARIDPTIQTFNAGVLLIRLDIWRAQHLTDKIRFWMTRNHERPIYEHGSQPPLLLSVGDAFERIDSSWNVDGAGFREIKHKLLENAKIVHWTGGKKGNEHDAWHHNVWKEFDKRECFSSELRRLKMRE